MPPTVEKIIMNTARIKVPISRVAKGEGESSVIGGDTTEPVIINKDNASRGTETKVAITPTIAPVFAPSLAERVVGERFA